MKTSVIALTIKIKTKKVRSPSHILERVPDVLSKNKFWLQKGCISLTGKTLHQGLFPEGNE